MDFLTPALLANAITILLCLLLLAAVWTDVKSHKIPNLLVFWGSLLGLVLNALLPEGLGFVSILPGAVGFWAAMAGLCLGLAIPMPMYLMRSLGAGDVKLIAMLGAFLGPASLCPAILLIFMTGGILSILAALRFGTLSLLLKNLHSMLLNGFILVTLREMPVFEIAKSAGKLPYSLAIAGGGFVYIGLLHFSSIDFFRIPWFVL